MPAGETPHAQHVAGEVEPAGGVGDQRSGPARAAEPSEEGNVEIDMKGRLAGRGLPLVDRIEPGRRRSPKWRDGHAKFAGKQRHDFVVRQTKPGRILRDRIDADETSRVVV